ncbi:hypothetical protein MN116_003318 [Schistosoma mekongi]|uniref:Uncharacterized protein n=1 Tax=Schistosoma mekongi TaxID=38744 RepID=A0AAE1ZHB4_SCHME|nr:hypothetical protein MN116_003318 [Schistosoma mekongi]
MADFKNECTTFETSNRKKIPISKFDNSEESVKTSLFSGAAWYIPSERRWETYDRHFELPRLTNRDAIDFQSEKDFVSFLNKRDIPNYKKITAYYSSVLPVKLNSVHQVLSSQLRSKSYYENKPSVMWEGTDYYGYYQEILDEMKAANCKKLISPHVIGSSCFKHKK